MRTVVNQVVFQMEPPSAEDRLQAAASWGSWASHEQWMQAWPCLNTVEVRPPAVPTEAPQSLRVGAWNLERCKWVEESAEVIQASGIDLLLATEMDWGMARSKQRHTTQDLATLLGWGYAFGVEFVELGMGDPRETQEFSGVANEQGLHGNALLSRWPLQKVRLIALDEGGLWYVQAPQQDGQHRVGGRMAVAAQLELEQGPLVAVSVHYESESNPEQRLLQTERLLERLNQEYGPVPMVIGGDLNTNHLSAATTNSQDRLHHPERWEPCFSCFADHQLRWQEANTGETTTRRGPHHSGEAPHLSLDWLLLRGSQGSAPHVVPALSRTGAYLSDHEMVVTHLSL